MEHVATSDIIINIALQVGNILLFFWLFIHFFGKPLSEALSARSAQEKKLAEADTVFKQTMLDAETQKQNIIHEGLTQKASILLEAQLLAQKKESDILIVAHQKADDLIQHAKMSIKTLEHDLEENFVNGVKRISKLVVQKIVGDSSSLQESYIEEISKQFSSSTNK